MSYSNIAIHIDDRGIATLCLSRPNKHNAMNDELIAEVTAAARSLDSDSNVRAVVLTGAGDSFCAGGDLKWMQAMATATRSQRIAGSAQLAAMLRVLNELSKPLIGRINGAAYGGGTGMISVGDFPTPADSARSARTKTPRGPPPANIAPF